LLGWWEDETKGYCLEDLQTKKLIISWDVKFIKNESPAETAVIDGGGRADTLSELTSEDMEPSKQAPTKMTAAQLEAHGDDTHADVPGPVD
jgi:hypothetical protein